MGPSNATHDYIYDEEAEEDEEDDDQVDNGDAYEAIRTLKLQNIGKGVVPQFQQQLFV